MDTKLTLNCWVYGTDVDRIFPVKISSTKTVAVLKEAIKSETLADSCDIDAIDLQLYAVLLPGMDDEQFEDRLKNVALGDGNRLGLQNTLSSVFAPSEKGEWLVVINAPNLVPRTARRVAPDISLNCWVRGDEITRIFTVNISSAKNGANLKEAVKNLIPDFHDTDADALDLYKVCLPHDDDLERTLRDLDLGRDALLRPLDILSNIFSEVPQTHLHIVVESSLSNVRDTLPRANEPDDILTMMTESFKLATAIALESSALSNAGKLNEYAKIQSGDQRTMNRRAADDSNVASIAAPPIQLFNPAFAYFSSKAFDPAYNVPEDFVRNVRDLMAGFALIYTNEEARRYQLRNLLETAIDRRLESASSADGIIPHFVALSLCGRLSLCLVVSGAKSEFGSGRFDPSAQAELLFQNLISRKTSELRLKSCCPVFIIAHAGPWLTVMGGIVTANCVVQRMTDFIWVPIHSSQDDGQCHRMARVLYALRESIQHLESWYYTLEKVAPSNPLDPAIHPQFYPSPDTYPCDGALVQFEYQRPLGRSDSCVTYLAKTLGDRPRDVVVKFVTTYGADAHRKMASIGFAPELLYHGLINVTPDMPSYGELRMVVTEYVTGWTLEGALTQSKVPSAFRVDLRRAISELHDAGYVFGDLRRPNVMVTPTIKLINFDWAGEEGKVKYPLMISSSVEWPEGVQGLEPIQKEHDLVMLDVLLSDCP